MYNFNPFIDKHNSQVTQFSSFYIKWKLARQLSTNNLANPYINSAECSKAHSEPSQTSKMELFGENS